MTEITVPPTRIASTLTMGSRCSLAAAASRGLGLAALPGRRAMPGSGQPLRALQVAAGPVGAFLGGEPMTLTIRLRGNVLQIHAGLVTLLQRVRRDITRGVKARAPFHGRPRRRHLLRCQHGQLFATTKSRNMNSV
jgi:hypothetical protein